MEDERQRKVNYCTQNIIALISEYSPESSNAAKKLSEIENTTRRVIRSIRIILDLAQRLPVLRENTALAFVKDIIQIVHSSEEVRLRLRAPILKRETIIFPLMRICFRNLDYIKELIELLGEDLLEQKDVRQNIALTYLPWPYLTRAMKNYFTYAKYFALMKDWWISTALNSKTFNAPEGEFELFECFECERRSQKSESILPAESNSEYNFEELPGDIIYWIVQRLWYRQIIPLALTSKHVYRTIMESTSIVNALSRQYFTGVRIAPGTYQKKHRARDHSYSTFLAPSLQVKSVDLHEHEVLVCSSSSPALTWYTFDTNTKGVIKYSVRIKQQGGIPPDLARSSKNLAARLHQGRAYAVHGNSMSVTINSSKIRGSIAIDNFAVENLVCDLIPPKNGYFTFHSSTLIGCGYSMDLTTHQFSAYPWTADLKIILMKDNTGYGTTSQGTSIKLFDPRAEGNRTPGIYVDDGAIYNFNVRDHAMYVVAKHLSEWDRRYSKKPVRMSTDPAYCVSWESANYRAVIDLTSMKVLAGEQLWDLAEFTWKFDKNMTYCRSLVSNGQVCIYAMKGGLLMQQIPVRFSN